MLYHTLHGIEVPRLGFGTWKLKGDEGTQAVETAIRAGYRHIDTAAVYENEDAVGAAIRNAGVPRDELFVTTKIWMEDIEAGDHDAAMDRSLERLGLDHVDLVLLHWPVPGMDIRDQVAPLARIGRSGRARLLGVSNYTSTQLREAVSYCDEPISCLQCEYHPRLDQDPVLKAARGFDMLFTSYSPLGQGEVLDNPAVARIAEAHGKSPAQVVLRWHLQQANVAAIPKATGADHIEGNFDIFDFELSGDEMKSLYGLVEPGSRLLDPDWAPDWETGVAAN
jgi:diketogulonate reductase-like aldo/keto reductase